jgi:iron complex outermembrane receptor protein
MEGVDGGVFGAMNLNLYAAYSEAFKPPRSPSGLNPPGVDDNLKPEDITNYEVGVNSSFLDGRASWQATYFQMERDGIVVSTQEGPFFRDSNAGTQDFEGFELTASWLARPDLRLHGNVAFYKNRFGDFVIEEEGEADIVLTGNRLPTVPDKIFNLGGIYQYDDQWGFTAGFKYVGDRFSDQNNILRLGSYTLVDASASWSMEPVRFTVSGHNLLNKTYFTSGGSNADSVNPAAPRQLVFIASYVYQ